MDGLECGGVPLRVPRVPPRVPPLPRPSAGSAGAGGTKKMRKRRELDALATKRCSTAANGSASAASAASGGLSSHDQLLTESSDDNPASYKHALGSGFSYTPGFAVKRGRGRAGRGGAGGGHHLLHRRPCAQLVRACIGLLILACVIATVTVMWLFIDIREQVFSLRTEIEQVVAGSQAVPDDLQKIHSLSRELQQNQTQLRLRVNTITAQITNLTQQLDTVHTGLLKYSDQLQSNPEPSNVKELKTNVALWGSQIKDLDNTVRSLKQQQAAIDSFTQTLGKNLTVIEASVSQISNVSLRPPTLEPNVVHTLDSLRQVVAQVSANISEANSTLSKQLQWLQDDQTKDHKAIEGLQDLGQNFTARIKTLEGECAKIDVQNTLNATVFGLKEQANVSAHRLSALELSLSLLQSAAQKNSSQVTQSSSIPLKPPVDSETPLEEAKSSPPTLLMTDAVGGVTTTPGG